jgi:hypothetical protein
MSVSDVVATTAQLRIPRAKGVAWVSSEFAARIEAHDHQTASKGWFDFSSESDASLGHMELFDGLFAYNPATVPIELGLE